MTWMDVVGGTPAPTFPGGQGYSAYYALTTEPPTPPDAPSGLTATAASSSAIDLAWLDNSNNEASFNIERSDDGANFSPVASVGANVVIYSDTGLTPNTTYWYRVNAANAAGASAWSNTDSATTLDDTGATAVDVGSVTVTTVGIGKGLKRGRATVVVVDDLGGLVEGATVTGDFSGTFDEQGHTGVTDLTGTTVIDTDGSQKGSVSVTFCVTSITHPALIPWTGYSCASN